MPIQRLSSYLVLYLEGQLQEAGHPLAINELGYGPVKNSDTFARGFPPGALTIAARKEKA